MSPRLMIGPTSVRCATMQEPLCPCQQRVASRTHCSSGAISADPLVAERQSTRLLQLLPRSKLDRGGSFPLMGMACSCGAASD